MLLLRCEGRVWGESVRGGRGEGEGVGKGVGEEREGVKGEGRWVYVKDIPVITIVFNWL